METSTPVSYTHLDVYKRQTSSCFLTHLIDSAVSITLQPDTGVSKRLSAAAQEILFNSGNEISWRTVSIAVSYTHLDVYKRQVKGNRI